MNIIITGTGFGFPSGTGATARVIAFAKGLSHHGSVVHVLLPKPSENKTTGDKNPNLKGIYEGIPFEYTCGQRLAAETRIGALFLYLRGLWRACRAIRRIHRESAVDAILLWNPESTINLLVFGILAKSLKSVIIAEESEFPFVYLRKTIGVQTRRWLNEKFAYKILDGVIVISECLRDFFAAYLNKTAKILQVPILVEPAFFEQTFTPVERKKRKIVYCGNLEHNGEVTALLQAFSQIAGEFPEWNVEVIGPKPQASIVEEIQAAIVRLGLEGRVVFAGTLPRMAIPKRLAEGDIMALPRASGLFSTAGFPTKLGEYLASGKPVVVTNTGDISHYLQDGVNAFMVQPDDIMAFASALRYVMLHPEEAREIGLRGRNIAVTQFNSHLHGERIIDFILSFSKNITNGS